MVPSRLAFLCEFERELGSISLLEWFKTARRQEPVLAEFADPASLRVFLQRDNRDPRKPQIWRALIRCFQVCQKPAHLFLLGLLEPALAHLMEKFLGDDLDEEDLWQETVACALAALSNPRLPKRPAVLAGLQLDTLNQLRQRLHRQLAQARNMDPLLEEMPSPTPTRPRVTIDEEEMLAKLCRRAGVGTEGFALIRLTGLQGRPLTDLAPHLSASYFRLARRRIAAGKRLASWLASHPDLEA